MIFYITFENRRGNVITERVRTSDPHAWIKRNTFKRYIVNVLAIAEG